MINQFKDIVAIDPGNRESAYVWLRLTDDTKIEIIEHCKCPNFDMRVFLRSLANKEREVYVAIEMVASYGMAVGADVFETCVAIGEFKEICRTRADHDLYYRKDIKMWHCGSTRAKDSNVIVSLCDKYADRQRHGKLGKGRKDDPGYFYQFSGDVWQAFALGAYVIESSVFLTYPNKKMLIGVD